jgi:hypothetical protein
VYLSCADGKKIKTELSIFIISNFNSNTSNFMVKKLVFISMLFLFVSEFSRAQEKQPSPGMAFLKSAIVPGWGHLSLGAEHKTRGYVHLGAEIGLWLSYFGIYTRTQSLEQNMFAHVEMKSGTSIQGRDRTYQLAIGQFSDIKAYNDYQERNRNWAAFIDENTANNWQWQSEKDQADYIRLRNEIDGNNQQLPFLVSAMVANRILSGISAFIRARNTLPIQPELGIIPMGNNSMAVNLRIGF